MVEASKQIVNDGGDYGVLNLLRVVPENCTPLFSQESLRLQLDVVLKRMIVAANEFSVAEGEDWEHGSYAENMQTAGFNEPAERLALGGVYNHLLMFSQLKCPDSITQKEPAGQLAESIAKYFTDFEGFKEAFRKAVHDRATPGWVWLGFETGQGRLLVTQTNNEDNPLMHGVVDVQCIPILGINLWEHAYLADYEGDKDAYTNAFFNQIDWAHVSTTFQEQNLQGKATSVNSV